jgi:hypothetical protein
MYRRLRSRRIDRRHVLVLAACAAAGVACSPPSTAQAGDRSHTTQARPRRGLRVERIPNASATRVVSRRLVAVPSARRVRHGPRMGVIRRAGLGSVRYRVVLLPRSTLSARCRCVRQPGLYRRPAALERHQGTEQRESHPETERVSMRHGAGRRFGGVHQPANLATGATVRRAARPETPDDGRSPIAALSAAIAAGVPGAMASMPSAPWIRLRGVLRLWERVHMSLSITRTRRTLLHGLWRPRVDHARATQLSCSGLREIGMPPSGH